MLIQFIHLFIHQNAYWVLLARQGPCKEGDVFTCFPQWSCPGGECSGKLRMPGEQDMCR